MRAGLIFTEGWDLMNIDDLDIFCQVVEEGNFSKVARQNFLSQPAITQKMNKLEERYEVALFQRAHGKITITPAARILYPFAKDIVKNYRHSTDAIAEYTETKEQTIHIGASFTIGEYMLPKAIGAFNAQRKEPIKFQLLIQNTPAILDALNKDEVEIACVEGVVADDNFFQKSIARDQLVPIVSAKHELAAQATVTRERFLQERIIWREQGSGMRQMVEQVLGTEMEHALELGSIQAIKSATEANLGVSFLPKIAITKELALGTLTEIAVDDIMLERDLVIAEKKQFFTRTMITEFKRFLATYFT